MEKQIVVYAMLLFYALTEYGVTVTVTFKKYGEK